MTWVAATLLCGLALLLLTLVLAPSWHRARQELEPSTPIMAYRVANGTLPGEDQNESWPAQASTEAPASPAPDYEPPAKSKGEAAAHANSPHDDPRFFSRRFRQSLQHDFGATTLQDPQPWRLLDQHSVHFKRYLLIGGRQAPQWREWQSMANSREFITILGGSARIPSQTVWRYDMYAPFALDVGQHVTLRALRCEANLTLEEHVTVTRWVDAATLTLKSHCLIAGRATATQKLTLYPHCQFYRLFAPCIHTVPALHEDSLITTRPGSTKMADDGEPSFLDHVAKGYRAWRPEPLPPEDSNYRHELAGDIAIPPQTEVTGDIICQGKLHLGYGCQIRGNIKAHGRIVIEPNVKIFGNTICDGDIDTGLGVSMFGAVAAKHQLNIGPDNQLGEATMMVSVSADHITLRTNTQIHGTLTARYQGLVLPYLADRTQVTA